MRGRRQGQTGCWWTISCGQDTTLLPSDWQRAQELRWEREEQNNDTHIQCASFPGSHTRQYGNLGMGLLPLVQAHSIHIYSVPQVCFSYRCTAVASSRLLLHTSYYTSANGKENGWFVVSSKRTSSEQDGNFRQVLGFLQSCYRLQQWLLQPCTGYVYQISKAPYVRYSAPGITDTKLKLSMVQSSTELPPN